MIGLRRSLLVLLTAFAVTAAFAQEHANRPAGHAEQGRQEQNAPGVLSLLPADSVTEHSIDTPKGKLAYTATAGTFSLFDQSGERAAAVFYTAYVAKSNAERRPLTFVFNGGPGAASAFLNLGLVGPRIAEFGILYTLISNVFSNAFHVLQGEIFPTAIRGRAAGSAYGLSRLSSAAMPFAMVPVLNRYGPGAMFMVIAAAMIIVVADIALFAPATTGRPLEEI